MATAGTTPRLPPAARPPRFTTFEDAQRALDGMHDRLTRTEAALRWALAQIETLLEA